MLTITYAECHTKAPFAECHYAQRCYTECRGANLGAQLGQSVALTRNYYNKHYKIGRAQQNNRFWANVVKLFTAVSYEFLQ